LIKLSFIETVFHILNRNLPQRSEVWPPGSLDINPFDYLKCGVSRRGINRSSHKKYQSLITTIMGVFSNIPREDLKRACSRFLFRLEEVIGTKGDFIRLKQSQYPTKQFGAGSLCCYLYLSCYHHFFPFI
jgi:hypothetical protein